MPMFQENFNSDHNILLFNKKSNINLILPRILSTPPRKPHQFWEHLHALLGSFQRSCCDPLSPHFFSFSTLVSVCYTPYALCPSELGLCFLNFSQLWCFSSWACRSHFWARIDLSPFSSSACQAHLWSSHCLWPIFYSLPSTDHSRPLPSSALWFFHPQYPPSNSSYKVSSSPNPPPIYSTSPSTANSKSWTSPSNPSSTQQSSDPNKSCASPFPCSCVSHQVIPPASFPCPSTAESPLSASHCSPW